MDAVLQERTERNAWTDPESSLERMVLLPEGRAVLLLVPLSVVAWMDGEPVLDELLAIAGYHAVERCGEELGCLSEEARRFFYYHFVYSRPSARLLGRALRLLADRLSALPSSEARHVAGLLSSACRDIARRAGGGLLRNGISAKEERAISEMLAFVGPRCDDSACELAASLGFGAQE